MILLALLALGLSLQALPGEAAAQKLKVGQEAFALGEFEQALRLYEQGVALGGGDAVLAQLHVAQAEVLAALKRFDRAELALATALEHAPELQLDASTVNPMLLARLEGLRGRLTGELRVTAEEPAGTVFIDGREVGPAPFQGEVRMGEHTLELATARGRVSQRVLVRPRRLQHIHLEVPAPLGEPAAPAVLALPPPLRPFLELRTSINPQVPSLFFEGGVGVSKGVWIGSVSYLHARVPGVCARLGLQGPELLGPVGAFVTLDVASFFPGSAVPGAGVSGGVSYAPWRAVELVGEVSGRLHSQYAGFESTYLLFSGGARLRLP